MANKQTTRFEGDVYIASSSEPSIYGTGSVVFEGDLIVNGSATITGGVDASHGSLTGLLNDDHPQYILSAGRSGGQIITSGTDSGNTLTIRSTSNVTKGSVIFDETTTSTSNSTGSLRILGGIGISNTTDATSSTNGGTFTTAGGIAIAKKAFIGTDLSIGGNITSGVWNGTTILVQYGGTGQAFLNSNSVLLGNGTSAIQAPASLTFSSSNLTTPKLTPNDTTASTSSSLGAVLLSGGLSISNTSEATSSTNGGTFTTAGGIAVAKKAFIGTDLSVGGNITSGTWAGTTLTVPVGGTGATTLNANSILLGNGTSAIQAPATLTFASTILTTPRLTSNDTTASTSSSLGAVLLSGGLSISNTTDASSATNGGTFTTAGGIAVAQRAFIGGNLSVGGSITSGTWAGTTLTVPVGGTGATTLNANSILLGNGTSAIQAPATLTFASSILTTPRLTSNDTTASTSSSLGAVLLSGGLSISNTTDASSATNGGTFTTAGGIAVAQRAFIGGNLSVGGSITSGTWAGTTLSVPVGGTGSTTLNVNSILLGNGTSAIQAPATITFASSILTTPRLTSNDTTASTSSSLGAILLSGGLSISNTTDASSATNGGTFTTAGGIAVAQRAFIGGNLSVGGSITSGTWAGTTLSVPVGGTGSTTLNVNSILLGNGTSAIQAPATLTFASSILTTPRLTSNDTTASTSSSLGAVLLSGGLSISNATDATSVTNGGTFTTAGGIAVAKKAFIGGVASFGNTIDMNNTKIINLATPTASSDAVTKSYVDLAIQGLDTKQSVVVATTVSGTMASSFQNGSIVDGITLITGNRILIKDQASVDNGVYTVNATGIPSRASDYQSGSTVAGSFLFVERGTVNADSGWVCISDIGSDIVGTNTLTYSQFSGAGSITAGTGLTKSGNTLSVNASQTQITSIGVITTGTWNATTITVPFGGTGDTALNANSILLGNGTSAIQAPATLTFASSILTTPRLTSNDTTASTSSSLGAVLLSGGLSISNTTDASSATNGGTFTTAGGIAVAQRAFIGGNLSVGGSITSGTWAGTTLSVPVGGTGVTTLNANSILLGNGTSAIQAPATLTFASTILTTPRLTSNDTTASTSSSVGAVLLSGGLSISNTVDASSSTNGGTFTTAGGIAVAQRAFIGGNLSVGGSIISGIWAGTTLAVPVGGTGNTTLTSNSVLIGNGTSSIQSPATLTFVSSTLTTPRLTTNDTTASTSSSVGSVLMSGGISISNVTDATSSTNGGTFTTAGGLSVAKRAFVGTDLTVGGNTILLGNLNVTGSINLSHSSLLNLTADDHTQYVLLAGRVGGQILTGGTGAGNNYTIRSTTNATKGSVILDETTASTSSITGCLRLSGGLGISNTTDATSISNGGTITTAGGASIAKQLFVGTNITSGTITITNSTQNILNINCQNSSINPGRILFTGSGGSGDFIISGDGGDIYWQGGGGRALQMGAFHEIRLNGGRATTAPIAFVAGSNATFNTIVQNLSDSIALRVQANSSQTLNLTQWVSSTGTVYSSVDSIGNFTIPICNMTNYIQMAGVTSPTNPAGGQFRYYTDTSDGLLKSRTSSGVVTIYQPCNTKGDIQTHNGTTNVKIPVSIDGSRLISDSTATAGISWNSASYAIIRDEKTTGTNGGTFTSGAWVTRTLNTTVSYPVGQNDISLTGNIITLDPGVYRVEAICPGNRCSRHTSRIVDNDTNAVLIVGTVVDSTTTQDLTTLSIASGILTVSTILNIRIEHRCTTTRNTNGLGIASGFQTEVYSQITIEKI